MEKTKNTASYSYLYPENEQYVKRLEKIPYSRDEIIENLSRNFVAFDLPPVKRAIAIFVTLALALACAFMAVLMFNIPSQPLASRLFMAFIFGLVCLMPIKGAYGLIMMRPEHINKMYQELEKYGVILTGQIETKDLHPMAGTVELVYGFRNPKGKKLYGRYTVSMFTAHRIEEVTVLYLNNQVHTLL